MTDPIPTTMNKLGNERIYVGSLFSIREPNSLQEANITHILTLIDTSFSSPSNYTTVTLEEHVGSQTHSGPATHSDHDTNLGRISESFSDSDSAIVPTHLVVPLHDYDSSPLLPYLSDCTSWIRQALASNNNTGTVLIHCSMGRSRSCAVAAAYLISESDPENRMTVNDALLRIKKARPSMNVNSGFIKQLEIWRHIGCPTSRQELEANDMYKEWKRGKKEVRQKRAGKERTDKAVAKGRRVNERDMKHWRDEGKKVERAIEKLDGQLGEALKRNTEIAQRVKSAQLEKGKMDDPGQVKQSGSAMGYV